LSLASVELAPYWDDLLVALQEGTIVAQGRRWVEEVYADPEPEHDGPPERTPIPPDDWLRTVNWREARLDVSDHPWQGEVYWGDIVILREDFEKVFFANQQSSPPKTRVRSGPKAHGDWKDLLTEVIDLVDERGQLPDDSAELKRYMLERTTDLDESTVAKYVRDLYARKAARQRSVAAS
jgi:hypothetical protein